MLEVLKKTEPRAKVIRPADQFWGWILSGCISVIVFTVKKSFIHRSKYAFRTIQQIALKNKGLLSDVNKPLARKMITKCCCPVINRAVNKCARSIVALWMYFWFASLLSCLEIQKKNKQTLVTDRVKTKLILWLVDSRGKLHAAPLWGGTMTSYSGIWISEHHLQLCSLQHNLDSSKLHPFN